MCGCCVVLDSERILTKYLSMCIRPDEGERGVGDRQRCVYHGGASKLFAFRCPLPAFCSGRGWLCGSMIWAIPEWGEEKGTKRNTFTKLLTGKRPLLRKSLFQKSPNAAMEMTLTGLSPRGSSQPALPPTAGGGR